MSDQENPPQVPYLMVNSQGSITCIELDRGTNTLVGTGSHCKVQLQVDGGVRSLHCILAFKEDGNLEVRDWNTGCTLVNGKAIQEATELREVDILKVGDHQIRAVLSAEKSVVVEIFDGHELITSPLPTDLIAQEQGGLTSVAPAVEVVSQPVDSLPQPETQPQAIPQPQQELVSVPTTTFQPSEPLAEPKVKVEAEEEVAVDSAVQLQIEALQSELQLESETQPGSESQLAPEVPLDPEVEVVSAVEPGIEAPIEVESQLQAKAEPEPPPEPQQIEEQASEQEPEPEQEPAPEPLEYAYDIDADFEEEADDAPAGFEAPQFADGFSDAEELELLRSENEQLRADLVEWSRRKPAQDPEVLNREQSMQLVSRLEEVLGELKVADARAESMNELLRTADQAKQDELEEREHIEKWLSQLEDRVTKRETETQAEVQLLKERLETARATQEKSNQCLESVLASKTSESNGATVPIELARDLKNHIESLQAQLNLAQSEASSLRQQLAQKESDSADEADLHDAEQKLAELEIEVSRERADISRQRVELNRLKAKLEPRSEDLGETNDSNEEDSAGESFANRISSLLQRATVG